MKKLITTAILSLITTLTFAQPWVKGGNNGLPPGSQPILGTDATWNAPLRIVTNGIERFKIMPGNTTSPAGRVAIGNNLLAGFVPQARLHLHQTAAVNAIRFTTDNMLGGNGFEVGYDATSNTTNQQYAEIHNRENTAIKFFTTGNNQRMHINPNRQSFINGYNVATSGFVGIGANSSNLWGNNAAPGIGPFSVLHLNDATGNLGSDDSGYRPWMRTGISFTSNEDFSYVGYRAFTDNNTSNGNITQNRNEFNIVWSNNPNTGSVGSDDMCFRFTNRVDLPGGQPNTIDAANLDNESDLDGRHIARFTAIGNMGLGPTFGEDDPVYVAPQSLLHMSRDQQKDTWLQVTNQTGTGQTVTDGLRIGITGTGTAHIRQQEILPLIFYTGSNTGAIEDARIVPQSALTLPPTNHGMIGLGDWTTAFNILPANVINAKLDIDGDLRIRTVTQRDTLTRVLVIDSADHNRVHWRSIASLGSVTANNGVSVNATTGAVQLGVPCQDSLGNNNLPEITANAFTEDRVVAIGDFNLWFATYAGDKGGVGIGGQPASTPFCGTGNTLEISANGASKYGAASSSGLRFNHLTSDSLTVPVGINGVVNTKVLTVDNDGDVVLVDALVGAGGSVTADNGLSIDPLNANNVQLGNGIGLTTAQLLNDREIPMNGFNTYFSGQGFNTDAVYIGYPTSTLVPIASKFSVIENVGSVNLPTFAGHFRNINIGTGATTEIIGVAGISDASQAMVAGIHNIGGYFNAENAPFNTGVIAISSSIGAKNIGVRASASGSTVNYGIRAEAPAVGLNRAGLFVGDVEMSNTAIITSDKMFKINVEDIRGATDVLRKLKPHTYKMDVTHFPQFNFQDRLQYGFIAQEVADVLPNLVHESYMPSELDSLGNEISPAVNYKSLNYNAFIPITVQAVIELNARVDNSTLSDQNVKTNVQNLANSLDKVKQMRGVSYEWSSSAQNDMNLDSLQHIGFIAQEIAAIEPLLTFTDDSSLVHVNYDRVAPLLVESVKELDKKNHTQDSIIQVLDSINNDLETRLAYLENCIRNANICTEGNRTMNTEPDDNINNRSVELVNTNSIILDQNLPNPFAENTVINYNIPVDVMEAKLLFYDLNGRIIKELIIEERGESKLTVYGSNLKTGVYTYSLIADGELIATKKMVKK